MQTMSGSPFAWLTFDEAGRLSAESPVEEVARLLAAPGVSDLVIISHGWKNDAADAHHLYATLWRNVVAALSAREPDKIVVCGIRWPAKTYGADIDGAALRMDGEGGTLSADSPSGGERRDLDPAAFDDALADFAALLGAEAAGVVEAARQAADGLDHANAQRLFERAAELMRSRRRTVEQATAGQSDTEAEQDVRPLEADDAYLRLISLTKPPTLAASPETGTALGLRDAVKEALAGPRAAIARFLNQLTYFEMKTRAGLVGARLGSDIVPRLPMPAGLRLHLVGHSFGARLVTAAASAMPADVPLFSLILLQGAFSHNALAERVEAGLPGAFANVVGRPSGPIVATHTHKDQACTLWYAIASRLSRDKAAALGDKDDLFGAMGANGPQKLDAGMLAPDNAGEPFSPVAGRVNRFLADDYIVPTNETDAHNNVTNAAVGRLIAAVIDMPDPPRVA